MCEGLYRPVALLNNENILVIDDVFDSGLSLAEVGRMLKQAGAGKLYAATIAKTPLGD